jgi:hypothetical protein
MRPPLPLSAGDGESRDDPHLPGLRTWRAVYVFVLGCYIAYVVVLAALSAWVA